MLHLWEVKRFEKTKLVRILSCESNPKTKQLIPPAISPLEIVIPNFIYLCFRVGGLDYNSKIRIYEILRDKDAISKFVCLSLSSVFTKMQSTCLLFQFEYYLKEKFL